MFYIELTIFLLQTTLWWPYTAMNRTMMVIWASRRETNSRSSTSKLRIQSTQHFVCSKTLCATRTKSEALVFTFPHLTGDLLHLSPPYSFATCFLSLSIVNYWIKAHKKKKSKSHMMGLKRGNLHFSHI